MCTAHTAVLRSPGKTRGCVGRRTRQEPPGMDVRCEKCQTEYELDEARLKPGGVTVKCTHCGHTFKVRKRSTTNVGTMADDRRGSEATRARANSSKQPLISPKRRPDSLFDEEGRQI